MLRRAFALPLLLRLLAAALVALPLFVVTLNLVFSARVEALPILLALASAIVIALVGGLLVLLLLLRLPRTVALVTAVVALIATVGLLRDPGPAELTPPAPATVEVPPETHYDLWLHFSRPGTRAAAIAFPDEPPSFNAPRDGLRELRNAAQRRDLPRNYAAYDEVRPWTEAIIAGGPCYDLATDDEAPVLHSQRLTGLTDAERLWALREIFGGSPRAAWDQWAKTYAFIDNLGAHPRRVLSLVVRGACEERLFGAGEALILHTPPTPEQAHAIRERLLAATPMPRQLARVSAWKATFEAQELATNRLSVLLFGEEEAAAFAADHPFRAFFLDLFAPLLLQPRAAGVERLAIVGQELAALDQESFANWGEQRRQPRPNPPTGLRWRNAVGKALAVPRDYPIDERVIPALVAVQSLRGQFITLLEEGPPPAPTP